jgi:hypothetical protein
VRGEADEGTRRGLVPGRGQDDAEVEACACDGRAERGRGGEDAQVSQVRVGVEARDADLGDERDDLREDGAAQEREHLA